MLPYILSILALIVMSRRAAYPRALMVPYRKGESDEILDLIIRGANLPDGRTGIDIGIKGERIAAVENAPAGQGRARDRRRAAGW